MLARRDHPGDDDGDLDGREADIDDHQRRRHRSPRGRCATLPKIAGLYVSQNERQLRVNGATSLAYNAVHRDDPPTIPRYGDHMSRIACATIISALFVKIG